MLSRNEIRILYLVLEKLAKGTPHSTLDAIRILAEKDCEVIGREAQKILDSAVCCPIINGVGITSKSDLLDVIADIVTHDRKAPDKIQILENYTPAVLGIKDYRIVYSYTAMVDHLMKKNHMDKESAFRYVDNDVLANIKGRSDAPIVLTSAEATTFSLGLDVPTEVLLRDDIYRKIRYDHVYADIRAQMDDNKLTDKQAEYAANLFIKKMQGNEDSYWQCINRAISEAKEKCKG